MIYILWITIATLTISLSTSKCALTTQRLKQFLANEYEKCETALYTKASLAQWNYETDIKNSTKYEISSNATLEDAAKKKTYWKKYFKDLNPEDYQDVQLKRQVKISKILGDAALDEQKLAELTNSTKEMTDIYSTAKICPFNKQKCDIEKKGLSLEEGIEEIFAKSTKYEELVYAWKAWRDASGAKMRELYKTYVKLSNEAAVANGFKDKGEMWRESYESPTFIQDIDDLWAQVEPLYVELHKYVGKKLKKFYGCKLDTSDGLIPAHVFGDMWAQDWINIAHLVRPFPKASSVDGNAALIKQNYTILDMFKASDDFYKSMGLLPNDICYNTSAGAMIVKPNDGREVVCHPSAWDFFDGQNYRIKMCTKVIFNDFVTIHHEMGHIQYYLQYAKQPYNFRNGANPGFHEAVGDTIALSVLTPKHLQKIGLIKNYIDTKESSINALMDMALQKIAFLPFGLLIDKWRWDVFSGRVQPDNWNAHWWECRKKYQRVKPPVERSERDFDPGAKYHVAADQQYISYFVSFILQFQFYKSFCTAAGEYNPDTKKVPLHKCDFYNSKAAGKKLSDGLSLGASLHWSDVLEVMTGERKMSAKPLMEYFEPLYVWLKGENSKLKL